MKLRKAANHHIREAVAMEYLGFWFKKLMKELIVYLNT